MEKLKQALEESGKEVAKLSYMLGITEDSDKKNKVTIAELKRQLDSLTQARNAELNILEEKLKLHSIVSSEFFLLDLCTPYFKLTT